MPHVAAVYAFARTADDGREGTRTVEERLRLLDWWGRMLHGLPWRAMDGRGDSRPPLQFLALHNTIHEKRLPLSLFDDL